MWARVKFYDEQTGEQMKKMRIEMIFKKPDCEANARTRLGDLKEV